MKLQLKRRLHHALFWFALLFMGPIVVESDIITGHHAAERLEKIRALYEEEPDEEDTKDGLSDIRIQAE